MLPMTFETFLEQGASKIDASVRELQRTYDEVVWGIENPPSYIEKKDAEESSSGKQKIARKSQKKPRNGGHGTPNSDSRGRFVRQRRRNQVQTTPSTVTDVDSLFNDGDGSINSYQGSTTSLTTSASESGIVTHKRQTPRWPMRPGGNAIAFESQPQQMSQTPSDNSILASHQTQPPTKIHGRLPKKIDVPPSIDEIFGYNTRQTISRQKAFADQDVGLDFCLLDAPTGSGKSRSLLIVQGINPNGLFANTELGVGDAVLAINGVNIRDEEQPPSSSLGRYWNQRNRGKGKGGASSSSSSFKPNIFKARALLNGRGLVVRIEYHKFGETAGSSSVCSSSAAPGRDIAGGNRYHNVMGITSGPAIATVAAALARDYPLVRDEQQKPQSPQRNSVYRSRRKASGPSLTRVDFLGELRTFEYGTDHQSVATYTTTSSSGSLTPKKHYTVHPSLESVPNAADVNISVSSNATTKTANTSTKDHPLPDNDVVSKSSETKVKAPPKISRLTRFKARTQNLRSSRKKTLVGANGGRKGSKIGPGDGKENAPNVVAPVAITAIKHESETTELDTSSLNSPYRLLLSRSDGPEEQMRLLKERVSSSLSENDGGTARSTRSVVEVGGGDGGAFHSPARSTRSESYLFNLRKGLSTTANAILDDLSLGATNVAPPPRPRPVGSPRGSSSGSSHSGNATAALTEEEQQEMKRVNRRVTHKLQITIDSLQRSNKRLTDELSAMRRRDDHKKLEQALRQLEQAAKKEKSYESELGLFQSRLDIANIQADKRHRELSESKERLAAENDKVIANLTLRIEYLEGTNRRLLEQLKKVESKRQERYNNLQAQFDRLKMKFSAQSTLLDNVMTSNEELTSQNRALESELHQASVLRPAVEAASSGESQAVSPTMFLAEASEYDTEHISRDPILLAQAKELSSLREQNADLEERVENLSSHLSDIGFHREGAERPEKEKRTSGLPPIQESRGDYAAVPSSNDSAAASDDTPSLLDKAFSSSGDEDSDASTQHRRNTRSSRPPRPRRKAASAAEPSPLYNPNNVSIDNPSDESAGFNVSLTETPTDEDSTGGCWRPGSPHRSRAFCSSEGQATNAFKLEYRHEYEDLARLGFDDDEDDDTADKERMSHRRDRPRQRNRRPSPAAVDESFESVGSLALMERILELETALQHAEDLDPDQTKEFLTALQSRMTKLNEKGYARFGCVEVQSTDDEGNVSVEVTDL